VRSTPEKPAGRKAIWASVSVSPPAAGDQLRLPLQPLQPGHAAGRHGERHFAAGRNRQAVEQDSGARHAGGGEQMLARGARPGGLALNRTLVEYRRH